MRYIIYWLIAAFIFTLFFFHQTSNALNKDYSDHKWAKYFVCLGYHHHIMEDMIKGTPDADTLNLIRENAKVTCTRYLPKEK